MGVKNVFLKGDVHEEVYMTPPIGIVDQLYKVCRVQRPIYGLKQTHHSWFEKFSIVLTSLGFVPNNHYVTLFVRWASARHILLSLYVDDMITTGDYYDGIE